MEDLGQRLRAAPTRVVVIGGGYAGMAAAVTLASRGVAVTVFEAAKVLGGRARRVEHRGLALDNGLHLLLGCYSETLKLIHRVHRNESADRLYQRRPLELRIPDRFRLKAAPLPSPFHLALGLAGARGLPLKERFAASCFFLALSFRHFRLPQDNSVAALLAGARQGPAACRFLWHPLCIAALNTPPEIASAQVYLNVLRDALAGDRRGSDLVLPRVDLSALFPEPAAGYVEARGGRVVTGTPVTTLSPRDGRFEVVAGKEQLSFTHAVVAVPPYRLASLLTGFPGLDPVTQTVRAFRYQPICSIYLQYPLSVRLPLPLVGLAGGHAQWLFDRGQLGGPPGLVGAVISAQGPHRRLSQDELARQVHEEICSGFPGIPEPLWARVIIEKRATFSCTVGLARPAAETRVPGLYLAGDYTETGYPATLEGAVRSGIQCARRILENL